MKLRFHTVDGEVQEVSAADVREVVSFRGVLFSPYIKKPYEGAIVYRGDILPVTGPVAHLWNSAGSYDERPWILVMKDHACVIQGLPEVIEAQAERSNLEEEILQLEKDLAA